MDIAYERLEHEDLKIWVPICFQDISAEQPFNWHRLEQTIEGFVSTYGYSKSREAVEHLMRRLRAEGNSGTSGFRHMQFGGLNVWCIRVDLFLRLPVYVI